MYILLTKHFLHFVDYTKGDIDPHEAMKYEISILGDEVVAHMLEQLAKFKAVKVPVISGDVLIEMGYPQGPLIGKIIGMVSGVFTADDPMEDKIAYVKSRFPQNEESWKK